MPHFSSASVLIAQDAKITLLLSKDLAECPGQEGLSAWRFGSVVRKAKQHETEFLVKDKRAQALLPVSLTAAGSLFRAP